MAQFAVYRNPNPDTRAAYPLPLDLRNDRLGDLDTRVSSTYSGFRRSAIKFAACQDKGNREKETSMPCR